MHAPPAHPAHAAARRPRLLRGAAEAAFPRARDRRRRSLLQGDAAGSQRRHPAHLRPDDARRGLRQRAQAEMGAGARHRRRRRHRPAVARQARHRHQHPRHPRRAGVGSRDHGHAGAQPRPAALGALAGPEQLDALAAEAARQQDRRHLRHRPDRRGAGAALQGVRHDGRRLLVDQARGARLRSHAAAQRPDRDREGARLPGPARPLLRRDPPLDRCEGVRRHEAVGVS